MLLRGRSVLSFSTHRSRVKWIPSVLKQTTDKASTGTLTPDSWSNALDYKLLFRAGSPVEWQNVLALSPLLFAKGQRAQDAWAPEALCCQNNPSWSPSWQLLGKLAFDLSALLERHCYCSLGNTSEALSPTCFNGICATAAAAVGTSSPCSPFLFLSFPAGKRKRQQGLALTCGSGHHFHGSRIPQKTPSLQENIHTQTLIFISPSINNLIPVLISPQMHLLQGGVGTHCGITRLRQWFSFISVIFNITNRNTRAAKCLAIPSG